MQIRDVLISLIYIPTHIHILSCIYITCTHFCMHTRDAVGLFQLAYPFDIKSWGVQRTAQPEIPTSIGKQNMWLQAQAACARFCWLAYGFTPTAWLLCPAQRASPSPCLHRSTTWWWEVVSSWCPHGGNLMYSGQVTIQPKLYFYKVFQIRKPIKTSYIKHSWAVGSGCPEG